MVVWKKAAHILFNGLENSARLKMFSFIKFYLLECVDYLNLANGRKSLLDLFPDVQTIFDSKVFEANI